ncbi:MAG: CDP-diacylglycerol--glycerol-3-phosphate 3-phosphatidyltransferase [Tenericutes bacterium HGW-Tenericutes-6]|jgi:CDP-diacylglycerol--glycerol-3-phosphate 3-phosphatidyltransferase|nr:MAG: CDP-diacylglycerol--glycerol-3-phosphate 3-phosphatidyltransferase [Tenericutes bacterium HGW-Tenericutes-6]
MTTANKLTILRVVMIPIMIVFIYLDGLKSQTGFFDMTQSRLIFTILFMIASFTDLLDGYIARKYNQITTFGKFLDPIADKVLVMVAFLYLMLETPDLVPLWAVMIVIVREFAVTGIRLLAVEKGNVIAASPYGKIKTATTMLALTMLLFNGFLLPIWISEIIFYIAIFFTVLSGFDYFWKNKKVILESI